MCCTKAAALLHCPSTAMPVPVQAGKCTQGQCCDINKGIIKPIGVHCR